MEIRATMPIRDFSMGAHASLMGELEEAVQSGSHERRVDTLRRITDLFLVAPARLGADQVGVFDDVLSHLIERVETKARVELSKRLAPVQKAPSAVIRRLACDDEIAVAGPMLTQSPRLSAADLVDIAQQKSQAHLLAIAGRDHIEERVTDVLVRRGDRQVVHTLATNIGASFSDVGYSTLVKRADGDEVLSEMLARRDDMPLQLFRDLLLRATEAVRVRLLASVSVDKQSGIRRVLEDVSGAIGREIPTMRNIEDAKRLVQMMMDTGRLNEGEILTFARQAKYDEAVAGLALLCKVRFDLIDRLMGGDRGDALLVPCRAAGFGWPTVRAVLELRRTRRPISDHEIESAAVEFNKLTAPTAGRVLRFWQVRETAALQSDVPAPITATSAG